MTRFTPEGWHTLTTRIVVADAQGLVSFIRDVFDGTGDYSPERPTVMAIGDSHLMISDEGNRAAMPAFLYVYVADADGTYKRAIKAGATTLEEPVDTPYGDRRAMVTDQWSNVWQIATWRPK